MGPEAARWLAEQDPDDPAVQVIRRALEGDDDAGAEVVAAVRAQRCPTCGGWGEVTDGDRVVACRRCYPDAYEAPEGEDR